MSANLTEFLSALEATAQTVEGSGEGRKFVPFLPGSRLTPVTYKQAMSFMVKALTKDGVDSGKSTVMAKQDAVAKMNVVKALCLQAAMNPSIVGNVSGITVINASVVATDVVNALEGSHIPSQSFYATDIARQSLILATTYYASVMAAKRDILDESGATNFRRIVLSSGVEAKYYPHGILTLAENIQAQYDQLAANPLFSHFASQIVDMAASKKGSSGINKSVFMQNSVCGSFHGIVPLLKNSLVELPSYAFRRESRGFRTEASAKAPSIDKVLALTTATMRAVLWSLLEMSIQLGHVEKEMLKNTTNTNAPNKAIYHVKVSSPFGRLVDLVCDYKRFYNSTAQSKDLPAYRQRLIAGGMSESEADKITILDPNLMWANISVNDAKTTYTIYGGSVQMELEPRARIMDFNNISVVNPNAPKPTSKEAPTPALTFFMKNPTEIVKAAAIFSTGSGDVSKLRQTTVARIKALVQNNIYANEAAAAQNILAHVTRLMSNAALIQLSKAVAVGVSNASVVGVEKAFK